MKKSEIIKRLKMLASEMYMIGNAMTHIDDPEFKQHGRELIGSGEIARTWIEEMEKGK